MEIKYLDVVSTDFMLRLDRLQRDKLIYAKREYRADQKVSLPFLHKEKFFCSMLIVKPIIYYEYSRLQRENEEKITIIKLYINIVYPNCEEITEAADPTRNVKKSFLTNINRITLRMQEPPFNDEGDLLLDFEFLTEPGKKTNKQK